MSNLQTVTCPVWCAGEWDEAEGLHSSADRTLAQDHHGHVLVATISANHGESDIVVFLETLMDNGVHGGPCCLAPADLRRAAEQLLDLAEELEPTEVELAAVTL